LIALATKAMLPILALFLLVPEDIIYGAVGSDVKG
jgi:hypothetical protein